MELFSEQCFKAHPRSRIGEPQGMQQPQAFETDTDGGAVFPCAEGQLTQVRCPFRRDSLRDTALLIILP